MTKLDAIRARQGEDRHARAKAAEQDVVWLLETLDILRASVEATDVLLSELGHATTEHVNRPDDTVCLDCLFVKNALDRLEAPDA